MGNLLMISQFLLSLTILVVLHECGHFFPARWFKTKVEKFYLFFNPWFSLFKKKIGETEYGLGWLPLGGYVKIAGMVDESMDTEALKADPQPWEFRSKKAWQRLIIMLGGVTVNFILGFFIFAMLLWTYGTRYINNDQLKYGILTDSLTYTMGFRDGDQIVKVGETPFTRFDISKIIKPLLLENVNEVTVLRNGENTVLHISNEHIAALAKPEFKGMRLWDIRLPSVIDSVIAGSNAEKAGIKAKDKIISVNGNAVAYQNEVSKYFKNNANTNFNLLILRNQDTIPIQVSTNNESQIGLYWDISNIKFETESYSFFESFPLGIKRGWTLLTDQLKAFGQMYNGKIKAKDSMGGFASIAKMFDTSWNWQSFWTMTAMLSIILAFMNLLPIPGLDGGYVVFLIWEVITGKKVSDKFIEKAVTVGFFILLALMIYVNGLDIFRLFK